MDYPVFHWNLGPFTLRQIAEHINADLKCNDENVLVRNFSGIEFANSTDITFLIDNNENIINSWTHDNAPVSHPYLLQDTSIIYPYKVSEPYLDGNVGGVGGGIKKLSKNGNVEILTTEASDKFDNHLNLFYESNHQSKTVQIS